MERMAASYFQEVYTKDPILNLDLVLQYVMPKSTVEMNEILCAPFSEKEV